MADKHVLKLAPRRVYFRDPVSGLFLIYPQKVVGELPLNADLTNIKRAVRHGELIDVNGTVFADEKEQAQPENQVAVVEQKDSVKEEVIQKEPVEEVKDDAVDAQESASADAEAEEHTEAKENKKPVRKKRR